MFQAALTVHDIDVDSAIWTRSSVTTDDRSSCRFSDEEVNECVYVYHKCYKCEGQKYAIANTDNICVVEFSKGSSVSTHAQH